MIYQLIKWIMINSKSLLPILLLFIFLGLISCKSNKTKQDIEEVFADIPKHQSLVKYAKGFDLYEKDGITKVVVYHPELSSVTLGTYYVSTSKKINQFAENDNLFLSPLDSVALFSATQINAFDKLGLLDKIVGISEANYIKNAYVKSRFNQGEIVELAGSGDFYVETTMVLNPSVIFYSPYKVIESHPLEVTGIPLIPFYDYHETDPLARAEWIKFSAVFFNKTELADSIFNEITTAYKRYLSIASNVREQPTVFSDKYFNGQWYVPGGQSYVAKILADAGSDYLWKSDPHTASFPLDYEVVYSKAYNADFWRIIGSYGDVATYDALGNENGLYQHFKAFEEKKIIWCDAEETAYFEKSPLEPQIVLADLIKAFHPELLPEYTPKYYHLLEK